MKHMKLLLVCITLVAAFLTAGCGGSDDQGGSSVSTTAPAANADSALHGKLPEELKSSGVLRVGTDPTIGVPFASFASDNETMVGLDVDLTNALAAKLGLELQLINTVFDSQITGLQAGRLDMTVSSMLDTAEREKQVDFVDFLRDGSGFLVTTDYDGPPATPENMCGRSVGALRGGFEFEVLSEQAAKCPDGMDVSAFDSVNNGLLALEAGRIDAFATGVSQNNYLAQASDGRFTPSGEPFDKALIGMAMPKESGLA
jgi:polar amino acid transport system substrate-binding protein